MLCNKQMQQPNAIKQAILYTTDFYRFLPLVVTRASYGQTCSDTKSVAPRLRETGSPRILAQISRRSLWNTTLLDIEQISSYCKNKYKGLMLQRFTSARRDYACDTTLALCQQQNNSQQRKSSSSGTTTKVVNSTPQGLWLGHNLAHTHQNLDKQSRNHDISCNLA